jgi:5'-nucleotidase
MARLLLANDDGIHAEGLVSLMVELAQDHEVYVTAPAREHSGMGHALTLHQPLEVQDMDLPPARAAIAVRGTPADSVKFALVEEFTDVKFDLVVSGINRGPNTGANLVYSGTVAAALEGVLCGVPAVAFSLDVGQVWDFDAAVRVAARLVEQVLVDPLPRSVALNINIPNLHADEMLPPRVVRMGASGYREFYIAAGRNPDGARRYSIDGIFHIREKELDYDAAALKAGHITITPLQVDFTARGALQPGQRWQHLVDGFAR